MAAHSERQRRAFLLLIFAGVASILLFLTWDLRPYPLSARVDDSRYVLSAHYIKLLPGKLFHHTVPLEWLGPYDQTTLVKRPGFSAVLAVLSVFRLPYLQTVLLLHLVGVGVFANGLLRLKYPPIVVGCTFVICGLFPTLYDANAVRVIREIATGALEMAILGLCVSLFTVKMQRSVEILYSPAFLVMLPLLGLHWSMREEAILLLPAVLLLTLGALWTRSRGSLRHKLALVALGALLILLPSRAAYYGVAALNRASYGVSLANEISEGSFPRSVNALKRVQESPCDHTLLTAAEAQKVLAVSPSFRVVGETLESVATRNPNVTYTDAFAIMRYAALQDEAILSSPALTQDLYSRIATEVEAACDSGQLKCAKRTLRGIVPLLCESQWPLVSSTFVGYLTDHIAKLSDSGLSPLSSNLPGLERLSPSLLAMFEEVSSQKMAGREGELVEFSQPASLELLQKQDHRRHGVSVVYRFVMPWLAAIGTAVLLFRLLFWSDRNRPWSLIILVALAGHVIGRAVVFSYLSAVDGYLNNRYISVCYPVAASFAALASMELVVMLRARRALGSKETQPMPAKSAQGVPWLPFVIAVLASASFIYAGSRPGLPIAQPRQALLDGELGRESGRETMKVEGQPIEVLSQSQGWLLEDAGWILGESAIFDGWSKDVVKEQPAMAVLIFVNDRLVHKSIPSVPWQEVEVGFPVDRHAGFNVRLPRTSVVDQNVRVFALLPGNRAGELSYPPSYPYRH